MIDITSTQSVVDGLASVSSDRVKYEQKGVKIDKGTELVERDTVDIEDAVMNKEQQDKKELIAEVKANLEKLNEYLPVTSTNLIFEFDEIGDPPIIKVLDKESDEVIREIPTKEFREVAKALDEFADKLTNKGLLFNKTA